MTTSPDTRRRELAQIHIAKKDLGLDDDTYRAMLFTIGRVKSSADLGDQGRKAVLEHLKAHGFKPKAPMQGAHGTLPPGHKSEWDWVNKAAPDRQAMLRKIAVMLKEAGREKAYADGMAKNMFHVEQVEWCKPDQLQRIVSALVFDQRRRAERTKA